jgi:hypothetical protein
MEAEVAIFGKDSGELREAGKFVDPRLAFAPSTNFLGRIVPGPTVLVRVGAGQQEARDGEQSAVVT